MARIFKHSYTKPIPVEAERLTRKGESFVRYWDRRGRRHEARVAQNGNRMVVETAKWYIEYRDALGITRRVPGFTDRQATEQRAAELERHAAREETGLVDPFIEHRKRPIADHVADWHDAVLASGQTPKHATLIKGRAMTILDGCGVRVWTDISAERVQSFIAERLKCGLATQTANHYLQAVKQFCRWMARNGRAPDNPLAYLSGRNVKTDRRLERRALTADELERLIRAAKSGPDRLGLSGKERAILYRLASETGLRVGELASLTRDSFDLDADHPTVTVSAAYSKRRRNDVLPLRACFAETLRPFLAEIAHGCPVFRMPQRTARMIQADLAAARTVWLAEATTPRERREREKSSFLRDIDDAGRVVDFHALRHTFITNLARGGVSPKVAQALARHSTIQLTMDRYTHTVLPELATALDVLPEIPEDDAEADQSGDAVAESEKTEEKPADSLVSGLVSGLAKRGSRPRIVRSAACTKVAQTAAQNVTAIPAAQRTCDRVSPAASATDRSGHRKPPAGLEPATCGLQNRPSTPTNTEKQGDFDSPIDGLVSGLVPRHETDPDLTAIIDAWHDLSAAVRRELIKRVRDATRSRA